MKLEKHIGRWVQIIYLDRQVKFSQRTVRVKRIDGDYLIAYCSQRKQVRRFAVDNILAVQLVMHHAV